jgi:hypothetical protein
LLKRIREAFTKPSAGYSYPNAKTFSETAVIPLADVMTLYERDPTCKSSVDLLAASSVGMGFYTTANEKYEKIEDAKRVVDEFNESVNLDGILNDMARVLIACGNDFWLRITPEKLADLRRLPIDAVEKIEQSYIQDNSLKIPDKIEGFKLRSTYGGESLKPEAVIHWRINCVGASGFGIGVLQVLLHTLTINSDKRPAYAWMKSKIEKIMPKIFEKYAGPDVLTYLEKADPATIQKFEKAIKDRSEEGAWLFYNKQCQVNPIQIDPRARFEYYIDHIVNQFYLGCETPLPRLFSTPGFTEASANAALDLQGMLIKPIQRYIKRQVERDIFASVLRQAGFDPAGAGIRLNWGSPETPEVIAADLIHAAELSLIRPEEFRKNAVKFGWELWEAAQQPNASQEAKK